MKRNAHMELDPSGPLFRSYTAALVDHPIILNAGSRHHQGLDKKQLEKKGTWFYHGTWASAVYYDRGTRCVQWVAAANPDRTSLSILCAKTKKEPVKFRVTVANAVVKGSARVWSVTCPAEMEKVHEKAGEPKPWKLETYTKDVGSTGGSFDLTMPPLGYMTFTVPMNIAQKEIK